MDEKYCCWVGLVSLVSFNLVIATFWSVILKVKHSKLILLQFSAKKYCKFVLIILKLLLLLWRDNKTNTGRMLQSQRPEIRFAIKNNIYEHAQIHFTWVTLDFEDFQRCQWAIPFLNQAGVLTNFSRAGGSKPCFSKGFLFLFHSDFPRGFLKVSRGFSPHKMSSIVVFQALFQKV